MAEEPESGCGCEESREGAPESEYQLEPAEIDKLIEWAITYNETRWDKGAERREEDEEFLVVISVLHDLWERRVMPEKQRLAFEEAFGLSGCRGGARVDRRM